MPTPRRPRSGAAPDAPRAAIALPSSRQPAPPVQKAPDAGEAPLPCVVLENGLRCTPPPERRGVCRHHHKILGRSRGVLAPRLLPARSTVGADAEDPRGGRRRALPRRRGRDARARRPPYTRGLCRAHYSLATQRGVLDTLALPPRVHMGTPSAPGTTGRTSTSTRTSSTTTPTTRSSGRPARRRASLSSSGVRAGDAWATVSLEAVKCVYTHVRYRLQRPPEEGGRGPPRRRRSGRPAPTWRPRSTGGGAWRFVGLDAAGVRPPLRLDRRRRSALEDALEFQTYQRARTGRAGPTMFVTRDTDFPEGVHPAHVARERGWR